VIYAELFSLVCSIVLQLMVMNFPYAILYSVILLFKAIFYYCMRGAIAFVALLISTSVSCLFQRPGLMLMALVCIILQAVWCLLCFGAYVYVEDHNWGGGATFCVILGFFWGIFVAQNITYTTGAIAIAEWYSTDPAAEKTLAHRVVPRTLAALGQALTRNFGSVCLGSLIMALLCVAIYYYNKAMQGAQKRPFLYATVKCLCACCLGTLAMLNSYAYVFVGRNRQSYFQAAWRTLQLVKETGLITILNDDLVAGVILVSISIGSICVCGVAGFVSVYVMDMGVTQILDILIIVIVGYLLGAAIMMAATVPLQASIATLFICFADDAETLAAYNPELHDALVGSWSENSWIGPPEFIKARQGAVKKGQGRKSSGEENQPSDAKRSRSRSQSGGRETPRSKKVKTPSISETKRGEKKKASKSTGKTKRRQ